jgi:hypothetical protein
MSRLSGAIRVSLMDWQPNSVARGAVQVYAPTTPPGDYAPSQFDRAANPAGIQWP